ncbi:MAG: CNNM domain-containing protein [Candidatus Omnitrophica bacterium]|nr:CNNM domain-containing protein [Candidatus Omnitrophota bacterium]MCF7894766.1 CNNM domain-containing protein [Candidatus Omnitrophota bacterium]
MIYLYILTSLIFFVLSGFFSASEIGFISSSRISLQHKKERKQKGASRAYDYLLQPDKLLTTILIGVNLSNILSASFLTFILITLGVGKSNIWTTLLFTPLVVVFADLVPKNVGRIYKEDFSCKTVGLIRFFEILFYPLVKLTIGINFLFKKVFLKGRKKTSFFVTKEEIRLLAEQIQKEGQIDFGERKAIEEVFEFRENKVKDFCLPRRKIVGFDYTDSNKYLLEKIKQYKFDRYPVYRNKKIIGYLNVYDLFYNPDQNWRELIRPITKIGVSQRLYQAFSTLQKKKENIALVIKGNKIYGMITLEDLTREILTSIVKF